MLVVKIELHGAMTGCVREIGRMYIVNDGASLDPKRGDYHAAICRRGTTDVPTPINSAGPKPTRTGVVLNYPRTSYNVWRLISRTLRSCFPEEK
jgi:hypothetical protein